MSNKKVVTCGVGCLMVAMVLFVFSSAVQAQYDPVTVFVVVSDDEKKLEITTPSQCTSGTGNGKGCVEAAHGKKIQIQIVFPVAGAACSQGGNWGLKEFYLGGEDAANKPTTWGNLVKAVKDFDVLNKDSGLVNPEPGSTAREMRIRDENTQKYVVWYKVTANCSGANPEVIETDPRIRNGGTG